MIPRKLKPCKTCTDPKYLFSHGNCLECYNRLKLVSKSTYTHVTLKQTSQQTAKPFRVIKKVSRKQLKRLEQYRKERDAHFKEFPVCQFPNCTSTDISLHHGAGKIGELLFNRKYFKSLCFPHHGWAEINPLEAQELGLSFKRLDK